MTDVNSTTTGIFSLYSDLISIVIIHVVQIYLTERSLLDADENHFKYRRARHLLGLAAKRGKRASIIYIFIYGNRRASNYAFFFEINGGLEH